ncbi:D-glycero-beta-D-manno-heptose 1-phosphate adenylyltransferase [Sporomusa acidovorans]|uniref:D-glycero-beta-D-manno-heptose 1-phosphate adenylyltransferase n=1 Tax=Sporomusa acidovorans (strain ATCC 49682 / DSM 3132 / Mol) TaxID=1123286 RepID=A0ABZ3J7M6_SPOA4|nr:D-glycero-beta-D-manno-heptose 1-phosphate adenylyltransferase [Sporomusa acidovorans]OZC19320.1 bifunctional protein HldE [Sporomusa acidovorans DSM 3132]SDD80909.1 rfaE bifunctional protein, domain II [Sporomusa acidovorans]
MSIVSRADISTLAATEKAAGKTIVFTNGCFDILHAGHVRYLTGARQLGDCLIVGLNSDKSVRSLKGPTRPVNSQDDRAEVLAGLRAVDYVVIFHEKTAENIINEIKPDIYAKGGDYCVKDLPESRVVEANGGRIVLLPEVVGRSSSRIIKKISDQTS